MENAKPKQWQLSNQLQKYDKIFFGLAFIFAFFFFSHPDLWETANHSYLFLESLFSGNFFNFYQYVAQHNNSYYYINVANYNILVYVLFGIWELPVFLFHKIFGLVLNETVLIYWAKIVSAGFFVGCGYLLQKLCLNLGFSKNNATLAALFFMFNPIAFFSPMIMGQYDTLCLFFTLWALHYYVKKDYAKFSFMIGIGLVFKFFPLLIFIPLILLAEKRIFHLVKYALLTLWLYIPSTLLFLGRTGNAAAFTQAMISRMFKVTLPTGFGTVSLFLLVYAMVAFGAFLYTPSSDKIKNYLAIYLCMVVFSVLFISIYWHPQWLILMVPFVVLTTFMQENKAPWFWLDIVWAAGFFLLCFFQFPNQTGAVLLDGGLFSHLSSLRVATSSNWVQLSHFLALIPYIQIFGSVMFVGAAAANIIFKFPYKNTTLANALSQPQPFDALSTKTFAYFIFIFGFLGMWLAPVLLEAFNAFSIL